jgi:hypothetical protein
MGAWCSLWRVWGCELSTFCIQSGDITQHLASMVKRLVRFLRKFRAVLLVRIAEQFRSWPEADLPFESEALPPPPPTSIAPATFERRFMQLHAQGRFDEMWEMLAEDAQRAWGSRDAFIRDMPRLGDETELLDMQVVSVAVVDGWTDQQHHRTYSNVARMVMRYRVRQQWREWTFDRQVHLIPAAGGWRTLCYPVGVGAS